MKKTALMVLTAALAATVVWAQTPVTSVNIVGFNKVTCPKGKYVLVSSAFKSLDGNPLKAADVFSNQLPMNATIYSYSYTKQTYVNDLYSFNEDTEQNEWTTNITFEGGMGFWIFVPQSASQSSYDVYLMGEVPMGAADTNMVYNGYNLLGFPYTASVLWTNTSLAKNAVMNDTLYTYDLSTGSYVPNVYVFDEDLEAYVWSNPNLVITPDMGFWFKTTRSMATNTEFRPYNP